MRLVDCYSDIFSYTLYLVSTPDADVSGEKAGEDLDRLFYDGDARAGAKEYAPADAENVKFAICAWVDEIILCSSWPGKQYWRDHQLQNKQFNTLNAGVEFYRRLKDLPKDDKDVFEAYALCLNLGFRGEYYAHGREEEFGSVRTRAQREALGRPPADFGGEARLLFPEAYAQKGAGRRFNAWKFDWWLFMIPVLAAILLAEAYVFLRNDLNIELLGYFGSLT